MKTITGVFSSIPELERAIRELHEIGVPDAAISVILGNEENRHREYIEKSKQASRTTGAAVGSGASFGGGCGIVASLVALAIPGVGPILAGGAIVTVLAGLGIGAGGGALMGAFHNMAISHEQAPLYEEAVRRGELLLVVEVDEEMEREVVDLMTVNGARNLEDMADTWTREGWKGPKADPHPYVYIDTLKNHEMPETVTEPVKSPK